MAGVATSCVELLSQGGGAMLTFQMHKIVPQCLTKVAWYIFLLTTVEDCH